ncbi:MAG: right-handed parallel beta-helix repeat-containing protein [Dokdonella sp.]
MKIRSPLSSFVARFVMPSLLVISSALALLAPISVRATTFIVNSTGDSGPGTLRQAILDANAQTMTGEFLCSGHQISFAIPGASVHTIQPLSALPPLLITINLDGFTQPGAVPNSAAQGNNSVLAIELDGSLAGNADGLLLSSSTCTAGGSVIRGLAINRFEGAGIRLETFCTPPMICPVGNVLIFGNFIGTDVTGSIAMGNGFGATLRPGIALGSNSTRTIIGDQVLEEGGPNDPIAADHNVISGNALDGILLDSTPPAAVSFDQRIRNNTIGLNAAGTAALPNGRHGIYAAIASDATRVQDNLIAGNLGDGVRILGNVSPSNILRNGIGIGENGVAFGNGGDGVHVGGASSQMTLGFRYTLSPFESASIANNGGAGVYVDDTSTLDTVVPSVAGNAGIAIDLAPGGITPNDDLDADTGPNELLNAPILTGASVDAALAGTITGTLNTTPGVPTEIHFYVSDGCGPGGNGEAQHVVSDGQIPVSATATGDALGNATFSAAAPFLPVGKFASAQSRRFSSIAIPPALEVSELSACVLVTSAVDLIFKDGFD